MVACAYPKTGNTWMRYFLGQYVANLLRLETPPLFDIRSAEPGVPSLVFTHFPLTWQTQTAGDLTEASVTAPFRERRVILLVRSPLDVLVSHYKQQRNLIATSAFSGTLEDFAWDPVFGIEKLTRYYSLWAAANCLAQNILVVRYEDLHRNPRAGFLRVLKFLSVQFDETAFQSALRASSFPAMKALEASGRAPTYPSSGMSLFASEFKVEGGESLHVRQGQVGAFVREFDPLVLEGLRAYVEQEFPRFPAATNPNA